MHEKRKIWGIRFGSFWETIIEEWPDTTEFEVFDIQKIPYTYSQINRIFLEYMISIYKWAFKNIYVFPKFYNGIA